MRRAGDWQELGVAIDATGSLAWQGAVACESLGRALAALDLPHDLPVGFESEVCPMLGSWIDEVTASLQRGVALFVDYGLSRSEYYRAERSRGTLRCHYRHRAHDDPFAHPGLEDITAWVDFTAVAEAADDCGLEVLGYGTQTGALLGLGIESAIVDAPDERTRIRRAAEARRLLMPTEMGENFKFIALGRGFTEPLAAFAHQDLRRYL